MVSYQHTGMKIPVRPAPAPPPSTSKSINQNSYHNSDKWDDSFISGMKNSPHPLDGVGVIKKKPPPRPPPPKFNQPLKKGKVPSRPSELLSGFFSRKSQKLRENQNNKLRPPKPPLPNHGSGFFNPNVTVASLIDLHSPPSSPTPTTRSSSDGVSVNSFGSDGPGPLRNAQAFESGFEDDFDFFGGLSSSNFKPITQNDPWTMNKNQQDPFSPITTSNIKTTTNFTKNIATTSTTTTTWFNNEQPSNIMPTIIRAKGPAPKPKFTNKNTHTKSDSKVNRCIISEDDDWSPPMPSIPPPPPPPEAYEDLDENTFNEDTNINQNHLPHGIAIYDFETMHSDDLPFQKNDTIYIENEVNGEWLYGRVGNRRGMFPANFIHIIVPFKSNGISGQIREENLVTAIYKFTAESWEDLEFPEGAKINVIRQINSDWLYGEYDGHTGQFPASFVDRIPTL